MNGDIALLWNGAFADVGVRDNDLEQDAGLRTAVLLSLFTDARADAGDVLPDDQTDRRGCWADGVPVVPGDRFGSRLWLLDRSKRVPDVPVRAESYAAEALQWMVADGVALSVVCAAQFLDLPLQGYEIAVTITRPSRDPVTFKFQRVWDAEAAQS